MQCVDTLHTLFFCIPFRKLCRAKMMILLSLLSSGKCILVTAALSETPGLLTEQELCSWQVVLAEPSSCKAPLGIFSTETEVNQAFAVTSLISYSVFKLIISAFLPVLLPSHVPRCSILLCLMACFKSRGLQGKERVQKPEVKNVPLTQDA